MCCISKASRNKERYRVENGFTDQLLDHDVITLCVYMCGGGGVEVDDDSFLLLIVVLK